MRLNFTRVYLVGDYIMVINNKLINLTIDIVEIVRSSMLIKN